MINLQNAYLFGDLAMFVVWAVLFFSRKDLRKDMILFGILSGVFGPIGGYYLWNIDWWHPPTITGTIVGVEDVLLGFFVGGIAAVCYEWFFIKKLSSKKIRGYQFNFTNLLLLVLGGMFCVYYLLGAHSFWAVNIPLLLGAVVILYYRHDLILDAFYSGLFMMLACLPFYYTIILTVPEWISQTYDKSLTGIKITGIPIEELIFYFCFGLIVGPSYEYLKGRRLVNKK